MLTDPHGGNIADDGLVHGLFDPGQYEALTAAEANVFVRMLASFSNPKWHRARKDELVGKLAALATKADNGVLLDSKRHSKPSSCGRDSSPF